MGLLDRERDLSSLIFLLIFCCSFLYAASAASGGGGAAPFVGVNIGTAVSNLLSPSDLASFLKSEQIAHVRLYNADASYLSALSGTGIRVVVGVPNSELIGIGSSPSTAAAWVARRILPFANTTLISSLAVGDEVATSYPSALPLLLPAMQALAAAISAANLSSIAVSTPISFSSTVLNPFPPSQALFNQTLVSPFILPLLSFLSNNSWPFMVNMYPYYSFMENQGLIPLDNALFKPLPPALEMVDPNTLLHYTNVYDAMIDAVYVSIRSLNFTNVSVLITETGWPSYGSKADEPYATNDNADTFNSNLISHVLGKPGTPLRPELTSSVFIYELFNEDMRPGPISEQNWGLFYGNGTAVYLLHPNGTGGFLANDTTDRTFCIAADEADDDALQAALDWACGPGHTDCAAIQAGGACYLPNSIKSHASYAFDSYYQMEGKGTGSCYFQGAATVTTTDPSYGSCIFPGSKQLDNTMTPGVNSTSHSAACRSTLLNTKTMMSGLMFLAASLLASTVTSNFWT